MSQVGEVTHIFSQLEIPEIPLADVVAGIRDPVSVISGEFRVLWANGEIRRRFGLSLDRIRGRLCYEVYLGKARQCARCPVADAFNTGKGCTMEKRFASDDGAAVWREVRAYPIRNRDGAIVAALRMGFDVTDRKLRLAKQARYLETLETALQEMTERSAGEAIETERGAPQHGLTRRELEVLDLMAKGLTNSDIAKILCISPHTVKSHVVHLFNKLEVSDRTEAAVKAVRLGLI